jgi:muconolactone delta-isomerase
MNQEKNFVVEMTLKAVPPETYQKLGRAEVEYTQQQMASGKLTQLLVTEDHRRYWMVFSLSCEQELHSVLQGFPLYHFFEYNYYQVMDMVAASEAGLTDPNLN